MRRALKEEGKTPVIDADDDMLLIQRKIQDVLGPLGVAWAQMELYMGVIPMVWTDPVWSISCRSQ